MKGLVILLLELPHLFEAGHIDGFREQYTSTLSYVLYSVFFPGTSQSPSRLKNLTLLDVLLAAYNDVTMIRLLRIFHEQECPWSTSM